MTLGNALKLIRTARGVKQRELAEQVGVSPNFLSMLEADRREPSLQLLRKLANKLQVPAGLFLMWTEMGRPARMRRKDAERLQELLVQIQRIYLQASRENDGESAA
jgi:transcriptional regulator with XRE-family HTH domain